MIKKLKIKFIATNMLLITTVMLVAFVVYYIDLESQLSKDSINAMHDISQSKQGGLEFFFRPDKKDNPKHSYLTTYVIEIDERTNTCYLEGFGDVENLSEEQLEYIKKLIYSVQKSGVKDGVLDEYNMRFLETDTMVGTRIVLLDKHYEDETLQRTVNVFIISGITAFAVFLLISVLVGNIAIKPVAESIKQQQQLVADVSHELKTPITVISANTDIVLSRPDSSVQEQEKWLGYIKDEAKRMSDLVSSMLYLAKTDEKEDKPILEEIDLSNAVYEISLIFESVCFENNRYFECDIESGIFIKGEVSLIKQLTVILLDNAVKYSNDNGKIKLSVRLQGDKAVISVFNTGEPIPKEHIPHVFERFYRVDKSRSRSQQSGGSGLGLSIAKRIIEHNEGSISVSSNDINGTVFNCSFKALKHKK